MLTHVPDAASTAVLSLTQVLTGPRSIFRNQIRMPGFQQRYQVRLQCQHQFPENIGNHPQYPYEPDGCEYQHRFLGHNELTRKKNNKHRTLGLNFIKHVNTDHIFRRTRTHRKKLRKFSDNFHEFTIMRQIVRRAIIAFTRAWAYAYAFNVKPVS